MLRKSMTKIFVFILWALNEVSQKGGFAKRGGSGERAFTPFFAG